MKAQIGFCPHPQETSMSNALLLATSQLIKTDFVRVKKFSFSHYGEDDMGRKTLEEIIRIMAIRHGDM